MPVLKIISESLRCKLTARITSAMAFNASSISRFVGADTLGYLSMSSLRKAVADDKHEYCYACYSGNYPTELVNIEELMSAKVRRS